MDFFIDPATVSWNIDFLNAYIHPDDVRIIKDLAISRYQRPDSNGWAFTDSGKCTVKSDYKIESQFSDKGLQEATFGPDIIPLLSHTWKLECPPKLRYFIRQAIKGIIPVTKNLRSRGIVCETQCCLCGAEKETINHVLFECPPALQTWALSRIPSAPGFFSIPLLFSNFDYLFWRLPNDYDFNSFLWILWYIWKNSNNKIYTTKISGPQEILRITEVEAVVWDDAQQLDTDRQSTSRMHHDWSLSEVSRICFVDGAWRAHDKFSG